MDFRPIERADLEACADVFYAADDELMARRGLPLSPRNRTALLRLFDHVSTTSPHRAWLVQKDTQIIGFGMAAQRDELAFLSFLFVLPDAQARGLGRALLERCMSGSTNRAVCIFSVQPVSAALYATSGMVPLVPLYTLIGRPKTDLPPLPFGLRVGSLDADQTTALDREVVGFTRAVDHAAWQSWERRLFGLYEQERVVGYGYAHQSGRLGPLVVRRADLLLPFAAQLMREVEPLEGWMIHLPGPAIETFQALVSAGMRLDGPPIIFCASQSRIDHSRYVPSTFALP